MRSLAQPCSVNNTFFSLWEGQKWGFIAKDRTYRAFLHNKPFFVMAPRDLHYYWASAQPCSVNNTFFSLWEGQKGDFFPKDRTYRAFLHNKFFFSDSPEGFALLLGQCAALRSLTQSTTPFLASGKAKNGVCSVRIAHIALFYKINFFSDSPEGFALLLGQCAALLSQQHLF